MRVIRSVAVAGALSATLLVPSASDACSCSGFALPCDDAIWRADAVFVGRVESIVPEGTERRVELEGVEVFRGPQASRMTIATGYSGGDCGYPFRVGESYLVYASRASDGRLYTSICSRTRSVGEAADDIAYARSIARIDPRSTARLAGHVQLWEYAAPPVSQLKRVPGVRVTASGGGLTFTTRADDRGEFELDGLPLGEYEVTASAPAGYHAATRTLKIHDSRGCGDLTLFINYDSRVRGRVVDSRGDGVGSVPLELVRASDLNLASPRNLTVRASTEPNGTFELKLVSPGEYVLLLGVPRRQFYPGVVDAAAAERIPVKAGERVHLRDVIISP